MNVTDAIASTKSRARALFSSLLPQPHNRSIVWLHNFEAERFWASPQTVQLPNIGSPQDTALVNRLEEFGIFLAQTNDTLILREPPDPAFLDYVVSLGFDRPSFVTVHPDNAHVPIAEAVLNSAAALKKLGDLSRTSSLIPFARTRLEEEIAHRTGLNFPGPTAALCEAINSKIYGRQVARALGLELIPGLECASLPSLESALEQVMRNVGPATPYVLKEAMGVSGKGLVVLDAVEKTRRILDLLRRRDHPRAQYAFVTERWVDKSRDINYQIFIHPDGEIELLAIKEILTEGGVHKGHRFPAVLSPGESACYRHAAELIGRRLWRDGYTGIAGIDSVIAKDGTVYPLLEINARFNMSTFHLAIEERLGNGYSALAKYYKLKLKETLPFEALSSALGSNLYSRASGRGVIVLNFAAVNCNVCQKASSSARGRLYVMLIGDSHDDVTRLDEIVSRRLLALTEFA